MSRLGPGDYGILPHFAEHAFFVAMRDVAPEILIAFKHQVWDLIVRSYEALAKQHEDLRLKGAFALYTEALSDYAYKFRDEDATHVSSGSPAGDLLQGVYQISSAMKTWAESCNLSSERWVCRHAVRTILRWTKSPENIDPLDWPVEPNIGPTPSFPLDLQKFDFSDEGWDPQRETWVNFRPRLVKAFESHLREYRMRMSNLMKSYSIPPVKRKRNVTGSPDLHFRWLVLYQCRGMSFGEIADQYTIRRKGQNKGRDDSTVSKAVREAARLVGLKLRSERKIRNGVVPLAETNS